MLDLRVGLAGGLERFELPERAVDGTLDGRFVAGQIRKAVGTDAVDVEGAGQAVVCIWRNGGRRLRLFAKGGVLFLLRVDSLLFRVLCGDLLEALAIDAGFHGERAVQAPLIGGDAADDHFLAVADGLEAAVEVIEEEEKLFGVLVEQDVFVGAQAVEEAIAAGCGFPGYGARAGGFLGVLPVGPEAGFGGGAGCFGIGHKRGVGRGSPYPRLDGRGRDAGDAGAFRASD